MISPLARSCELAPILVRDEAEGWLKLVAISMLAVDLISGRQEYGFMEARFSSRGHAGLSCLTSPHHVLGPCGLESRRAFFQFTTLFCSIR